MVYTESRKPGLRSGRALAGKALIVFVCAMLALTIANRALNELATPLVSVVNPQRGALEKRIDADGRISAEHEVAVYADAEIKIGAVHARVGQTVSEGDILFSLDPNALMAALDQARAELIELRNNREKAAGSADDAPDDSAVVAAEQALARAQQDLASKSEEQRRAVELAQWELSSAEAERDEALAAYERAMRDAYDEYLEGKQDALETATRTLEDKRQAYEYAKADLSKYTSDQYDDYQDNVDTRQARYDEATIAVADKQSEYDAAVGTDGEAKARSALKSAESTLKTAKDSLDYWIRRRDQISGIRDYHEKKLAYERAQQDFDVAQAEHQDALNRTEAVERKLDQTCEAKKEALDSAESALDAKRMALETAELDRDKAIREAERTREDAQVSLDTRRRELRQTELDVQNQDAAISEKQAELSRLEILSLASGAVYAPTSGQITACDVSVGATASTSASAVKIGKLDQGLLLRVVLTENDASEAGVGDEADISIGDQAYTCAITAIAPSASEPGKYELCFALPARVGQAGMNASMTLKKRTKNYDTLVPLSALMQDDMGYFIYRIVSVEGALGAEMRVERIDVRVLDQDSMRAAVSGGMDMRDNLVARSDRDITEGDRVRTE